MEVVQLLGLQGFWQHQVLSWQLGQQEIQCSRRYGSQFGPIHSSILAWRSPLTEKPGRPQSIGLQRVGQDRSDPVHEDARFFFFFFCLWQLSPLRVASEGGAAAWLAGTLAAPSVQGHRLPLRQELCPSQSLFF